MRSFKTEGIIIKRNNYAEADRILTVFTKYHGKIRVKAVGIRKISSRRAAHVELLNHCCLNLYRGKTYPILTEVQSVDNFPQIKNDFNKIGLAFHLCELIDGLCPENQENQQVFFLFKNILTQLSQASSRQSSAHIDQFELQLLRLLGYLPAEQLELTAGSQNWENSRIFIEDILERRLKSREIFSKLQ